MAKFKILSAKWIGSLLRFDVELKEEVPAAGKSFLVWHEHARYPFEVVTVEKEEGHVYIHCRNDILAQHARSDIYSTMFANVEVDTEDPSLAARHAYEFSRPGFSLPKKKAWWKFW